MFAALRAAMKYSVALPVARELVEEIYRAMKDDGSINQKERSKLMSKFWKLVGVIQIEAGYEPKSKPVKSKRKAPKKAA